MKKEKSISISNYFEFKKPKYIFIRVTPSSSIRNYNTDSILTLISKLYINIHDRIKSINNKLFFECEAKVGYYIYLEKQNVQFYFVVPEKQFSMFKDKIIDVWSNKVALETVDSIPNFSPDCTKYCMGYRNLDSMSLDCDRRNNALLGSQLNTLHIMEDGDKAGIFYNFYPYNNRMWRSKYEKEIKAIADGEPIYHSRKSAKYSIFSLITLIITALDFVTETIFDTISGSGATSSKSGKGQNNSYELSTFTKKKRDNQIINTQILCFAECSDRMREENIVSSLCGSFDCVNGDNMLMPYRVNKKVDLLKDKKIKGCDVLRTQMGECQNFIGIPGRRLLLEHKSIIHTELTECQVPEKLRHGYMYLGGSTYHGKVTKAYLRDNFDQGNLPLVLIGEQGSGKTTFIKECVKNAHKHGDGVVIIDFIKNCETCIKIQKDYPEDSIVIDMSDIDGCQGIGYNELQPKSNDYKDILECVNRKALYLESLVDALNEKGEPLTTQMQKYLNAACMVVGVNGYDSLRDVVKCLTDYEFRKKCIENMDQFYQEYLADEIVSLSEINAKEKDGKFTTNYIKIDGISHRINLLKKDIRLKMMFNKPIDRNVDLVKAMDSGKIVLIKMPQEFFITPYAKNVVVTYFITKIWAASIVRGSKQDKPRRVNLFIDEVFQAKTTMRLLKEQEILPQTRKFALKSIFSCQHLGQIDDISETLHASGASYMFMKGASKKDYMEFKNDLFPYTIDDLVKLPQYHSLNLINYEDGKAKFITKLPYGEDS